MFYSQSCIHFLRVNDSLNNETNKSTEFELNCHYDSGHCPCFITEKSFPNTMNICFNRYEIIEPPDGEWGRFVNGSWTGLIGQLAEKVSW